MNLDDPPFSQAQCDALFAAVLIDDQVDAEIVLPAAIQLDYTADQLLQCYRICRQIWWGVDRRELVDIIRTVRTRRALTPDEQRVFKHIRAKFKHLRFAYVNFDDRHRYPRVLHAVTSTMGRLQDAFKNGQARAIGSEGGLSLLLLTPPVYALVSREVDAFRPSGVESFRASVDKQLAKIRHAVAEPTVSALEFHEARKIISRQVSMYDCLRTIYPSAYHDQISRYLSAINGLMGGLHDDLIAARFSGAQDYHRDTFVMPDEIRRMLQAFVDRH